VPAVSRTGPLSVGVPVPAGLIERILAGPGHAEAATQESPDRVEIEPSVAAHTAEERAAAGSARRGIGLARDGDPERAEKECRVHLCEDRPVGSEELFQRPVERPQGDAIESRRLWFVYGADWRERLTKLLDDQPGLSLPTQFIRLQTTPPEQVTALVNDAQSLFSNVTSRRSELTRALRERPRPPSRNATPVACVIAPSRFRLWESTAEQLLSSSREFEVRRFDPDDPSGKSIMRRGTM
jgi:hypothetical protein